MTGSSSVLNEVKQIEQKTTFQQTPLPFHWAVVSLPLWVVARQAVGRSVELAQ